jgi:hypothetical protein
VRPDAATALGRRPSMTTGSGKVVDLDERSSFISTPALAARVEEGHAYPDAIDWRDTASSAGAFNLLQPRLERGSSGQLDRCRAWRQDVHELRRAQRLSARSARRPCDPHSVDGEVGRVPQFDVPRVVELSRGVRRTPEALDSRRHDRPRSYPRSLGSDQEFIAVCIPLPLTLEGPEREVAGDDRCAYTDDGRTGSDPRQEGVDRPRVMLGSDEPVQLGKHLGIITHPGATA